MNDFVDVGVVVLREWFLLKVAKQEVEVVPATTADDIAGASYPKSKQEYWCKCWSPS
jgi:hypothetical protein